MKIYIHRSSTGTQQKYLFLNVQEAENEIWVEINVDNERQKLEVRKIRNKEMVSDEWKVFDDFTFPSSILNHFLVKEFTNEIKWDYIKGWKKSGRITPELLVKWAYLENGYFSEQDEDLMMFRPELINTMHDLMIDEYSKRKLDLNKILKCYAKDVYRNGKDIEAIREFEKIVDLKIEDILHKNLKNYIVELKKEYC